MITVETFEREMKSGRLEDREVRLGVWWNQGVKSGHVENGCASHRLFLAGTRHHVLGNIARATPGAKVEML